MGTNYRAGAAAGSGAGAARPGAVRKKIAIVFGAVLVLLIVIFSTVGIVVNADKTATLVVEVAPASAEININGELYENGTYRLEPGVYHIKISKEGFDEFEKDVELESNKTNYLYHYLTQPGGDMSWYAEHKSDAMLLNTIGDHKAEVEAKEYLDKDPILAIVPYHSYEDGFNIDAEFDEAGSDSAGGSSKGSDGEKLVVKIELLSCRADTRERLKEAAQEYLKGHGIKLENYDVRYVKSC